MTEKVPSFKTGGTFWFTDLTTADTTYILPLLTAITFIITVESNMQEGMEGNPVEGNPVAGTMKKFSRIIVFLSIPILMGIEKEEVDSVISDIPRDGPRRPTKNAVRDWAAFSEPHPAQDRPAVSRPKINLISCIFPLFYPFTHVHFDHID
ncbi:mitochondrial inner membrane protein OXA1-like isoform X2 [Brassica napus]|nr:mitochondrial inner membrane protein OXA1-like isoform X2 [Brassica napus]